MLGIGIVGAGNIFEQHAAAIEAANDRVKCVGLAEVDVAKRDAAAAKYFIPLCFQDYGDLLSRDDIDVVAICTPPATHEEMVVAALEAGRYVICEKPLAHTLASVDRISEVASHFPGRLSTVFQLRYAPEFERIRWMREQGLLGELRFGNLRRLDRLVSSSSLQSGWWGRWSVAGGGAVMTQFVHHLDQMCCLFGTPVEVSASMTTSEQSIESEDTFSATVRFANESIVTCGGTVNAQTFEVSWDIVGTEACVHLPWRLSCRNARRKEQILRQLKESGNNPPDHRAPGRMRRVLQKLRLVSRAGAPRTLTPHARYYRAILDAIDQGKELPVSPHEARTAVDLAVGIYTSAMTSQAVRLPLDSKSPYYDGITQEDYQACRNRAQDEVSVP